MIREANFSVPAFRSHATIALVDRGCIQFYHENHSVILVSSALSFSESDRTGGLEKLIVIMIAFGRLTLCDSDILHNLRNYNQQRRQAAYTPINRTEKLLLVASDSSLRRDENQHCISRH